MRFPAGSDADDVWFDLIGNDLIVGLRDGTDDLLSLSDRITIVNFRDQLDRVEEIAFTDGTVLRTADIFADLSGHAGNDSIAWSETALGFDGGAGNDTVSAGAFNDTIFGGAGNDSIAGGYGNDYEDGGTGNDTLLGQFGDDTLIGGDGNDTIDGGVHNDLLIGGAGNDLLLGSAGDGAMMNETTGEDTLSGGAGADTLYGGGGNDLYVYQAGDGRDFIHDQYIFRGQSPLGAVYAPEDLNAGNDTL